MKCPCGKEGWKIRRYDERGYTSHECEAGHRFIDTPHKITRFIEGEPQFRKNEKAKEYHAYRKAVRNKERDASIIAKFNRGYDLEKLCADYKMDLPKLRHILDSKHDKRGMIEIKEGNKRTIRFV